MIADKRIVAVDFDGTIVKDQKNPHLKTNFTLMPNAKEVLTWLYENFYVILWTCRDGIILNNAVNFLSSKGIQFHMINKNMPSVRFKTSGKIYADFYFENRSVFNECEDIDWLKLKDFLTEKYLCEDENIMIEKIVDVVVTEPPQIATFEQLKELANN